MNKLPVPNVDDKSTFDSLSKNSMLDSFPDLMPILATVEASYAQYIAVSGNPALIQNPQISHAQAKFLKGHYKSPPSDLAYISKLRESTEHLLCPMCGSMHCGTLDHYLPKNGYPIFSVFSKNLVPACKCNSKRKETLLGVSPNQRILHPYFDNCLRERLIGARFDDLGKVPRVSLVLTVPKTHPDYAAIDFHVQEIVKRSAICKYIAARWSKFYQKPSLVIRALKKNVVTQAAVKVLLETEISDFGLDPITQYRRYV